MLEIIPSHLAARMKLRTRRHEEKAKNGHTWRDEFLELIHGNVPPTYRGFRKFQGRMDGPGITLMLFWP